MLNCTGRGSTLHLHPAHMYSWGIQKTSVMLVTITMLYTLMTFRETKLWQIDAGAYIGPSLAVKTLNMPKYVYIYNLMKAMLFMHVCVNDQTKPVFFHCAQIIFYAS